MTDSAMPEDPTTNQLLADILNRLDNIEPQLKLLGGLVGEMPKIADTVLFLMQAVRELQESFPPDLAERVERLEK